MDSDIVRFLLCLLEEGNEPAQEQEVRNVFGKFRALFVSVLLSGVEGTSRTVQSVQARYHMLFPVCYLHTSSCGGVLVTNARCRGCRRSSKLETLTPP